MGKEYRWGDNDINVNQKARDSSFDLLEWTTAVYVMAFCNYMKCCRSFKSMGPEQTMMYTHTSGQRTKEITMMPAHTTAHWRHQSPHLYLGHYSDKNNNIDQIRVECRRMNSGVCLIGCRDGHAKQKKQWRCSQACVSKKSPWSTHPNQVCLSNSWQQYILLSKILSHGV